MTAPATALADRIGISRLANLTGLDRVGYPVVAAIRPMSRNLSVSMGKGGTLDQAKVSAVMEAAELRFSERPAGGVVRARFAEMSPGSALDPMLLGPLDETDDLSQAALDWVQGRSLNSGRPVAVPWQAVSMDFSERACETPRRLAFGATGLAAAFDEPRAVLHGLLEVIERDRHNAWNSLPDSTRLQTLTDPCQTGNRDLKWVLEMIADADLSAFVWDMTGDGGIPCYLAEVVEFAAAAAVPFAQGAAAHVDAGTAIEKALAEALQVRLAYISGSRDDLEWADYGNRYDAVVESRRWLAGQPVGPHCPVAGRAADDDAAAAVARICRSLRESGAGDVVAVPLSGPGDSVSAVKVMAIGLRDTPDANFFDRRRRQAMKG